MPWRLPAGQADRKRIHEQARAVVAAEDVGRAVERRQLRAEEQAVGAAQRGLAVAVDVQRRGHSRRNVVTAERKRVGEARACEVRDGDVEIGEALMLVAEPALEREARADTPVVLRKQRHLAVVKRALAVAVPLHVQRGQARAERVERAQARGQQARDGRQRRKCVRAAEVVAEQRLLVDGHHVDAGLERMARPGKGKRVLQLDAPVQAVGRDAGPSGPPRPRRAA